MDTQAYFHHSEDEKKGGDPAVTALFISVCQADQAFSDAGSILKPGPMVEDRVIRLT